MRRDERHDGTGVRSVAPYVSGALSSLSAAVDGLVAVEVSGLSDGSLAAVLAGIATVEGRLAAVKARVVSAAASSGAVRRSGAAHPAGYVAGVTGGSHRVGHATSELGRAIEAEPALGDALTAGRIGVEQATVVSQAVRRGLLDADDRRRFVRDAATLTPDQLRRSVRRREAVLDQDRLRRDEARAHARRFLRMRDEADGSVWGEFRLAGEAGQAWKAAVAACTVPDGSDVPDDARRTPDQRRADGLAELARRLCDGGGLPDVRGVKPHVSVVVPVAMLTSSLDDAEAAGAVGTLPDGGILSAAATRRLLCDATVRRVVVDPDGRPLDVGRATRVWSGAQRAALAAVDGGCRGPGCDRPFGWTDIHHVVWWRHGGDTSIGNGVALCRHCHQLVHDRGWTISLDPASRVARWVSPTGEVVETRPRGPAVTEVRPPTGLRERRAEGSGASADGAGDGQACLAFERVGVYELAPPVTVRPDAEARCVTRVAERPAFGRAGASRSRGGWRPLPAGSGRGRVAPRGYRPRHA